MLRKATLTEIKPNPIEKSSDVKGNHRYPRIIAAIPCFNEERFIGSVVIKTRKHVDEVVVVDDGSSDTSAVIARDAGAVIYSHGSNRGYGAAIQSALESGREHDADILVIFDGDGQHDPDDIPTVIKPIVDGDADVVIGSRFIGEGSEAPFYRRVGQRVLNIATNIGSGQKVSDSQSGFRAYSAKALDKLHLAETGMSVSSEIQFMISKGGLRVAEVPIGVSYTEKAKRNPIEHGMSVLSRVLVLFSLKHPLLLFGLPGSLLSISGIILGLQVIAVFSDTGKIAIGTALATIILALSGLLMLFTSLMLQAMKELLKGIVAQITKEIKNYSSTE